MDKDEPFGYRFGFRGKVKFGMDLVKILISDPGYPISLHLNFKIKIRKRIRKYVLFVDISFKKCFTKILFKSCLCTTPPGNRKIPPSEIVPPPSRNPPPVER